MTLIITQENEFMSVAVHDTTKGAVEGRVFNGDAQTVNEAKHLAMNKAKLYLRRVEPVDDVEWLPFGAPTPVTWV